MQIKKWKHTKVNKDGTFENRLGAIYTEQRVYLIDGNCGLGNCHCSEGHHLVICEGRNKNKTVNGLTITFKDKKEMRQILGV